MKAPKNIVFLSVDSIRILKYIPVLRVKVHLPEIVVDGYRIKKNTKNLYLTIDTSYESEFIIYSDYTLLEDHIDSVNIVRDKLKDYRIGKILKSAYPDTAVDILNGLVVKTYINYIATAYKDYDGFNINVDPTDPKFISVSYLEEKYNSGKLITQFSEMVVKLLEEQI